MKTKEFFTTRTGLWVSSSFKERMIFEDGKVEQVDSFDLTENSYDSEIEQKPVTLSTVQSLIEKQWNGEEGKLLVNGYTNLFYVVGANGVLFVVRVRWRADFRRWGVDAWGLDESGDWNAGYRVFRNTQTLSTPALEPLSSALENAIKLVKESGYKVIKEM